MTGQNYVTTQLSLQPLDLWKSILWNRTTPKWLVRPQRLATHCGRRNSEAQQRFKQRGEQLKVLQDIREHAFHDPFEWERIVLEDYYGALPSDFMPGQFLEGKVLQDRHQREHCRGSHKGLKPYLDGKHQKHNSEGLELKHRTQDSVPFQI